MQHVADHSLVGADGEGTWLSSLPAKLVVFDRLSAIVQELAPFARAVNANSEQEFFEAKWLRLKAQSFVDTTTSIRN